MFIYINIYVYIYKYTLHVCPIGDEAEYFSTCSFCSVTFVLSL